MCNKFYIQKHISVTRRTFLFFKISRSIYGEYIQTCQLVHLRKPTVLKPATNLELLLMGMHLEGNVKFVALMTK